MAKTKTVELEAQLEQLRNVNQDLIRFSNDQLRRFASIENTINAFPVEKASKSIWWVITNIGTILAFVKTLVEQIREWRNQINSLVKPSPESQPNNN